jgi:hypothetical protein
MSYVNYSQNTTPKDGLKTLISRWLSKLWKCGTSQNPLLRRGEMGTIGSWWSDRPSRTLVGFGC